MLRALIAVVTTVPLLMACSDLVQPEGISAVTPAQTDLVNATCANVMGLRKGDYYFAQCQDSLANSLRRRDEAWRMVANEESCRGLERNPGSTTIASLDGNSAPPARLDRNSASATLATCMLDKESNATAPLPPRPVSLTSAAIEPGRSYYSIRPSTQFQRERYSCAQLGLVPGSGAFGECVAGLQGALLPAD